MLDSIGVCLGARAPFSQAIGDPIGGFDAWLVERGYAPATVAQSVMFAAGMRRWLEAHGRSVADVDEQCIGTALKRGQGRVSRGRRRALLHFLEYLRDHGIAAPRVPVADCSPAARLEERYARYLCEERGLAAVTVVNYRSLVRRFLVDRFEAGPTHAAELRAREVTDFLLRHLRVMSPKRAQLMGCALRSFLRFLFLEAETSADLSLAVPTVRQFRKATTPRYLAPEDVERVVAGCELATPVGRRNHAVLLLLARLGLRASEIVKLELGDVHWRSGELMVRGKGAVHDRLPLPKDVGEALALYVTRDRSACASRRLFLRMRAPRRGFANSAAVSTIVERAIERSGLRPPHRGAHLLRHSLATGMIRRGATMAEIGQLLRHRSPSTTELYAKVDFEGLRGIALPWPGTGGGL